MDIVVDIVDTADIVDIVDTVDIVDIVDTVDTLDTVHTVDNSHEESHAPGLDYTRMAHPGLKLKALRIGQEFRC